MDYVAELETLKNKYNKARIFYYNEKAKMDQLLDQKSRLEDLLQRIIDNIGVLEQVRILLQKVSEYAREQSRQQIEALVTNCLQFIFDSNIEFRIEIEEIRGRPEAEFYVISNVNGDIIRTRPQEARGGGIVDIISLALRIAMIQCCSTDIKGPLILDEPAKHVSEDYITQVAEFLKQVSSMFDMQIIMVTHNRHLSEIANRWYRIDMQDGISRILNDS